ncbi:hypothetical protein JKP88DRAFT_129499, partial [Tribonema minus]
YSAEQLPRSDIGDYIEQRVKATQPAGTSPIAVRLVTNKQLAMVVPPPIRATFCAAARELPGGIVQRDPLPEAIEYTSKVLCLFQEVNGLWVLLFIVYTQEYGADAPACNRARAYIAYVDSIAHWQPCSRRSAAYKEMLVGYIDWVRLRSFRRVHLWSAPPQEGDSYVLWCRPQHQPPPPPRTQHAWLRQWYHSIARGCEALG